MFPLFHLFMKYFAFHATSPQQLQAKLALKVVFEKAISNYLHCTENLAES